MKISDERPVGTGEVTRLAAKVAKTCLETGKAVEIMRGVDYFSSDNAVKQVMYQYGYNHKLRVITSTKRRYGSVLVLFLREDKA